MGGIAIDRYLPLRGVFNAVGANTGQNRALGCGREYLPACGQQGLVPRAAAIQQAEAETAGVAQFLNGRRHQRQHECLADLVELCRGPS